MTAPDIVLITGAGWKPINELRLKGKWRERVPYRTPELLWPVAPGFIVGNTVLSRYMIQFGKLGVTRVFAGVGAPGIDPTPVEYRHQKKFGQRLDHYGEPVWTHGRIKYIQDLGAIPIRMKDAHEAGKCCWHTAIACLKYLMKATGWETLMMLPGDYTLRTSFIESLFLDVVYPTQLWLLPRHDIHFMRRDDVPGYIEWLEGLPRMNQNYSWELRGQLEEKDWRVLQFWSFPSKGASKEQVAKQSADRRRNFCEVGPGELPFCWALAEEDPA